MSSSLKKVSSGISSVIYGNGGIGSALFPQQDTTALDNLLAYYRGVDTSMADDTLSNLEQEAFDLSGSLTDYVSSVDGSDKAREQAQNAVWQSYVSSLMPSYEQQRDDLNTRLLNQGLTIGSEAYQRAMNDLTQAQNSALNQAAYQSVTAGNEIFNDTFSNALKNAELANDVRTAELDEIYGLLANTLTKEELMNKIYEIQSGIDKVNYQNERSIFDGINDLAGSTAKVLTGIGKLKGK